MARKRAQKVGAPPRPRSGSFLERHWRSVLVALFAVALAWRLGYVARLVASPLFGSLPADERVYWDWATYLMGHQFRGNNAFFFGPLYPHVLALLRSVFGSEIRSILVVQAVWGAASAALVADTARHLVRREIALAAGLVFAFYEMAVFFDGLILMESLVLFLEVMLLWLWSRAAGRDGGAWGFVAMGFVTGLVTLGRATGGILLLPAAWIAWGEGKDRRKAVGRLVTLFATFLLTIAPATAWNWIAAKEFIPVTYNFGYNLYVGNNPRATGRFVWISGPRQLGLVKASAPDGGAEADGREYLKATEGLELSPGQSSTVWGRKALSFIRDNPVSAVALVGTKLILFWNAREQPQFEDVDLYRKLVGPVGAPFLGSFFLIGVLGLMGLTRMRRMSTLERSLQVYVMLITLSVVPFFVTDRYRVHLVPGLLLLAAASVERFWTIVRQRKSNILGGILLPCAATIVLVSLPVPRGSSDYTAWTQARDLGTRWAERGRPDLAAGEFERALRLEEVLESQPDYPDPQSRAPLYFNYAIALRGLGRRDAAIPWFRAAAEAAPDNARFVRTLADAYLVTGRQREGDSLLRRAESLVGGRSELSLSRGYQAAREGRVAAAESLFAQAVESDIRNYAAWGALIRIQVQRAELARARETLGRVARTGMPQHAMNLYQAYVAAASGDTASARRTLESIPPVSSQDPTLAWVRNATERLIAGQR